MVVYKIRTAEGRPIVWDAYEQFKDDGMFIEFKFPDPVVVAALLAELKKQAPDTEFVVIKEEMEIEDADFIGDVDYVKKKVEEVNNNKEREA